MVLTVYHNNIDCPTLNSVSQLRTGKKLPTQAPGIKLPSKGGLNTTMAPTCYSAGLYDTLRKQQQFALSQVSLTHH